MLDAIEEEADSFHLPAIKETAGSLRRGSSGIKLKWKITVSVHLQEEEEEEEEDTMTYLKLGILLPLTRLVVDVLLIIEADLEN